jgi:anthranilate synthase component 1
MAHATAGAGIVADSVPATEYEETLNKARAVERALELAECLVVPAPEEPPAPRARAATAHG